MVFYSELPDVPTHARGVMRAGEWTTPHCGNLVIDVIETTVQPPEMYAELASWYRHEAGFFAGKGTQKAPCADPMACDIADIARAIDEVWTR